MRESRLRKLAGIGGPALASPETLVNDEFARLGRVGSELTELYRQKNGFYAFESALHVFPARGSVDQMDVQRWNSTELWRFEYGDLIESQFVFFAEDVFGNQFAVGPDGAYLFDAETAGLELIGTSVEAWADSLLREYDVQTGYVTAHEWQAVHGCIPQGHRLIPKLPFVLGGDAEIGNLYLGESVAAMRFRGDLARQLASVSDGTQIEIDVRSPD